jgi:hypothetical protein
MDVQQPSLLPAGVLQATCAHQQQCNNKMAVVGVQLCFDDDYAADVVEGSFAFTNAASTSVLMYCLIMLHCVFTPLLSWVAPGFTRWPEMADTIW